MNFTIKLSYAVLFVALSLHSSKALACEPCYTGGNGSTPGEAIKIGCITDVVLIYEAIDLYIQNRFNLASQQLNIYYPINLRLDRYQKVKTVNPAGNPQTFWFDVSIGRSLIDISAPIKTPSELEKLIKQFASDDDCDGSAKYGTHE